VYAEVGQVSHQLQQNIPSSFLNLDDTPIEYAEINHKLHKSDKINSLRVLPLKPVGMYHVVCMYAISIEDMDC
jgi:hypothetical protein